MSKLQAKPKSQSKVRRIVGGVTRRIGPTGAKRKGH